MGARGRAMQYPIDPWVYYWLSVAVLAALLFVPASRLIWALSVRRLERKGGRALSDAERRGQLGRARFLAVLLCLAFSALFNFQILGMSGRG
jgi:hypothetical protein